MLKTFVKVTILSIEIKENKSFIIYNFYDNTTSQTEFLIKEIKMS